MVSEWWVDKVGRGWGLTLELLWGQSDRNLSTKVMTVSSAIDILIGGMLV